MNRLSSPALRGQGPQDDPPVLAQGGTGAATPAPSDALPVKWGCVSHSRTMLVRRCPPIPDFYGSCSGVNMKGSCCHTSSLCPAGRGCARLSPSPHDSRFSITASAPAVGSTSLKASLSLSVDMPLEGQPGHRLHLAVLRGVLQQGHHTRNQPTLLGEFLRRFLMAVPMLSNCLPGFPTFWSYACVFAWEEVSGGP